MSLRSLRESAVVTVRFFVGQDRENAFDPVFSSLAWALIFGLFASTLFTLIVIPVTYFAMYNHKHKEMMT